SFSGWGGDGNATDSPLSVTMEGPKSVTATFVADAYPLDVTVSGNGAVTKSPDQGVYGYGTVVKLSAVPATGWHFVGWSGDASSTANPLSLVMTGSRSLTATFAINTYPLAITTSGNGSVSKNPNRATYDHGTAVTLTATPATGWYFVGWSGDVTSAVNPLSLTMDGPKSVTATFAAEMYTLDATANGTGTVRKGTNQ